MQRHRLTFPRNPALVPQGHPHIHEHAAEMRRYYQDIEERTAPERKEVAS